jgi:hypothetical protein
LQQRSVDLHQKSSAQELAKVALQQENLSPAAGKTFRVARERCFAAQQA